MNQEELLTVEDSFMIDGLGLNVGPDFSVPKKDWKPSKENITVERPDGTRINAEAKFNHSHFNIPDPSVPLDRRWRVTICILNIDKGNVPKGSKLLVRTELAKQLLEAQV